MMSKLSVFFILTLFGYTFNTGLSHEYSCALTEDEYLQLKEVRRKMRETDREWKKQLHKINPSFAYKYAQFKTRKEKMAYITYLVNHEFDTAYIDRPDSKHILEFLKSLNFAVVSAEDVDRCYPVKEEVRREYGDSLHFYYSSLAGSGCELFVYGVTQRQDMDKLACFLRKLRIDIKLEPFTCSFMRRRFSNR